MYLYNICAALEQIEKVPSSRGNVLVLLTSEELKQGVNVPGLEHILCHTPSPQDAHMCKAESRHHSAAHQEPVLYCLWLPSD